MVAFLLLLLLFSGRLAARDPRVFTPPAGSAERREILDALRKDMRTLHGIDMVFVVKFLKVQDGWAWTETFPQSADGRARYEGVSALLKKSGGYWRVVEIACSEPDNPDCLDDAGYFRKLKGRFPGLPAAILPPGSIPSRHGK